EDRKEVTARRFLYQDGGDVAPIAATPEAGDFQARPLNRGRAAVTRTQGVIERGGQQSGSATPVAQIFAGEPGEEWIVRNARPDLAQTIFLHAESQAPFEDLGRLLAHDHFEPPAASAEVGRRSVDGQSPFADQ